MFSAVPEILQTSITYHTTGMQFFHDNQDLSPTLEKRLVYGLLCLSLSQQLTHKHYNFKQWYKFTQVLWQSVEEKIVTDTLYSTVQALLNLLLCILCIDTSCTHQTAAPVKKNNKNPPQILHDQICLYIPILVWQNLHTVTGHLQDEDESPY